MKDCQFCSKEMFGGNTWAHGECESEWHRRNDNNLCTRCGKAGTEGYCGDCHNGSPFVGYENCFPA